MDFEHLHEKYRFDLLEKIKIAANIGDSDTIKKCSEMLEKLDRVKMLISEISNEFKLLENFLNIRSNEPEPINRFDTPKMKGERRVLEFIKKINNVGIYLNQSKGRKYLNRSKKIIGIATATENPKIKNKWFLGLPDDDYYSMVLICEDRLRNIYNFVFSNEFIMQYKNKFSRDKKNQMKFHILKKENSFAFYIPKIKQISIEHFLDKFYYLN